MLNRRSRLTSPNGTSWELPLLVPSFSSKGFGFSKIGRKTDDARRSHVSSDLSDFGTSATSCVLLSGYDLHFKHFRDLREPTRHPLDLLKQASLVFVDSGGYELSPDFDTTEPKSHPYSPRSGYGPAEYELVLADIAKRSAKQDFMVANFDWGTRGQPLPNQIRAARRLARLAPNALHGFILKPWGPRITVVDPRQMSDDDLANLRGFASIGVTEKELGVDLFIRLKRVAELRARLDRNGVSAPIHVWGGLDPILTPLYFFAGAQLFDGISWLRYAFVNGLAVNRESAVVLDQHLDVDSPRGLAHPMVSMSNRTFLDRLAGHLQQWVDFEGQRFDMFEPTIRDQLARAYSTMCTRIPELGGNH